MSYSPAVILYDAAGVALKTISTTPASINDTALVTKSVPSPLYNETLLNQSVAAANNTYLHGIAHDVVTVWCRVRSGAATSVDFTIHEMFPGGSTTAERSGYSVTVNIPSADFSTSEYRLLTFKGLRTTSINISVTPNGGSATVDAILMGKFPGYVNERPTFYAVYDRIVPAANKYMATLFNPNSKRVYAVRRIWSHNWQVAVVTGVILEQYLARITARTTGTTVTIQNADTADASLTQTAVADHNSSAVSEAHVIRRFWAGSEEMVLTSTGLTLGAAANRDYQLLYDVAAGMRPITLRSSEGISIRNVTSSTAGSVSYVIEFTME